MRILLPSATIAAVTAGGFFVSADTSTTKEQTNDNTAPTQEVDPSSNIRKRAAGEECNNFSKDSTATTKKSGGTKQMFDVGILGCNPNQVCQPDPSSSLGGRCTSSTSTSAAVDDPGAHLLKEPITRPRMPAFPSRRTSLLPKQQQSVRILQRNETGLAGNTTAEEPFVCPTDCPQDFCDCAEDDGDASKCAAELHDVCIQNLLAACVPDKYLTFYTETYCPFAQCLAVDNRPYEECGCGYYKDYCQVYYAYEQSIEKCDIGICCDGQPAGQKFTCLPALEPTGSPTLNPTVSAAPSMLPTSTASPTTSTAPTISSAPTIMPSTSFAPTSSSMPTPEPTDMPSSQPSRSSEPTTTPTKAPTLRPTTPPTLSPTVSPSDMPSYPPSSTPSTSPTISSAPSRSSAPSDNPTSTSAPTSSGAPTDAPSMSAAPTLPPSTSPTQTFEPSATPSTSPPTRSPSVNPTGSPTASPSDPPSKSPVTPFPSMSPTTAEPTDEPTSSPIVSLDRSPGESAPSSGRSVQSGKVMMMALAMGVGGAMLLFA